MQIGCTPTPYLCTMRYKIYCKRYKYYYWYCDAESVESAKEIIESDSFLKTWDEVSVWLGKDKVYVAFNR